MKVVQPIQWNIIKICRYIKHHFCGNGTVQNGGGDAGKQERCNIWKRPGDVHAAWNKMACLTLVLYPNLLTGELKILLGIETDYRWVHIFNELSAHESPSMQKHEQWILPRVHDPD